MKIILSSDKSLTPEQKRLGANEFCYIEQDSKVIGSFPMYIGQRVFELDLKESMIYETGCISMEPLIGEDKVIRRRRKLIAQKDHIYCAALTWTEAQEKFRTFLKLKPPKENQFIKCEQEGCEQEGIIHTNFGCFCQEHINELTINQ